MQQVSAPGELLLTVDTFSRWARNLVGQVDPLGERGDTWIRTLLRGIGIPRQRQEYFVDEIKYIQGRFPPDRREEYLEAARLGRGRAPAVPRELRGRLLEDVLRPYDLRKRESGHVDWNDIALRASEVPNQHYDIMIVDESQDLSANQIRTILAHLDEDHTTTFIIDAVQRIYPQSFQWAEVGINMRPQLVYTLASNHRNTAEIARLASSLVVGLPAEPDGVLPDAASCRGSGPRPKVVTGKYRAQIGFMLDRVSAGLAVGDTVAILQPRGGQWFNFARGLLHQRDIPYCELTRNPEWPTGPEQVALSTFHSAKGLEFDHVLMPGLNEEVTPYGDEDGDGSLESLRRLVAMGVGRAKKTVLMGYKPGARSGIFDLIDPDTYDLVEL